MADELEEEGEDGEEEEEEEEEEDYDGDEDEKAMEKNNLIKKQGLATSSGITSIAVTASATFPAAPPLPPLPSEVGVGVVVAVVFLAAGVTVWCTSERVTTGPCTVNTWGSCIAFKCSAT
jgi:hypothetical protein